MEHRDPDCVFCRIIAGELPSLVVAEDEHTLAFLDVNPATPGHTIVIPRNHSRDIHAIGPEDLTATMATAQRVAGLVRDRLDIVGLNLFNNCGAQAWQTVFHFHVHVVPRYANDPIQLPWIPQPGDQDQLRAAHERLTA